MRSLECAARFPSLQRHCYYQLLPLPLVSAASFRKKSSQSFNTSLLVYKCNWLGLRPPCALPESGHSESLVHGDGDKDVDGTGSKQQEKQQVIRTATTTTTAVTEEANSATIISSCLVGLLTGIAVVVFNNAVRHLLPIHLYNINLLKLILARD